MPQIASSSRRASAYRDRHRYSESSPRARRASSPPAGDPSPSPRLRMTPARGPSESVLLSSRRSCRGGARRAPEPAKDLPCNPCRTLSRGIHDRKIVQDPRNLQARREQYRHELPFEFLLRDRVFDFFPRPPRSDGIFREHKHDSIGALERASAFQKPVAARKKLAMRVPNI